MSPGALRLLSPVGSAARGTSQPRKTKSAPVDAKISAGAVGQQKSEKATSLERNWLFLVRVLSQNDKTATHTPAPALLLSPEGRRQEAVGWDCSVEH